jgi:hypothetical protein
MAVPKRSPLQGTIVILLREASSDGSGGAVFMFGFDGLSKNEAFFIFIQVFSIKKPGNGLLSHTVTHVVPSALGSLTSVFGMGTGVTSPP